MATNQKGGSDSFQEKRKRIEFLSLASEVSTSAKRIKIAEILYALRILIGFWALGNTLGGQRLGGG